MKELQSALLNLVDLHVRKEYLNEIKTAIVVPLDERNKEIIPEKSMRLFHIEKISYSFETNVSDKIKVILESLARDCGSVIFLVNGKQNYVDLYMGVCDSYHGNISGQFALQHGVFRAVYPGSECSRLKNSENTALIHDFFRKTKNFLLLQFLAFQ